MEVWQVMAALVIGLAAGLLGGLAGVGGSILILPSLGWVFGYPAATTHHGYMAAAMTVNVAVAIPAALRHRRAGAVRTDLLGVLVPVTGITLALGVLASNRLPGWQLQLLLAGFLILYCGQLTWQVFRRHGEHPHGPQLVTRGRLAWSASATGFTAGLLGLGGGVLQVPLLQVLCRVPLRQAIATSAAVICLTAFIGATIKLSTLSGEGESPLRALVLAGAMIPTAVVGARLGAALTHRLNLQWVRGVIVVMLLISAYRLASAGGRLGGWW
jgi:uncharacterized membrane protein YfcA